MNCGKCTYYVKCYEQETVFMGGGGVVCWTFDYLYNFSVNQNNSKIKILSEKVK